MEYILGKAINKREVTYTSWNALKDLRERCQKKCHVHYKIFPGLFYLC
jgi:hypothetical protein